MKGYIADKDGCTTALPELLSWDICHGMGEPCDWFEVSFIYYAGLLPALGSACRFTAEHRGERVFTGVIDEYTISIDEKGSVVTISGRSYAALLLDNELCAGQWEHISMAQAVESFVSPYGIETAEADSDAALSAFSVSSGESAWSAIKRFCSYSKRTTPYFTKDGKLVLNNRAGNAIEIDASKDAAGISLCDERYGIISDISIRNRYSGTVSTVENSDFIIRGGKCHKELSVPKSTGADAVRYTADYQISQSMRGKRAVKITITQQFACFPGDRVKLTADKLGVNGTFTVISTHCWADSMSAGTIVTLEV